MSCSLLQCFELNSNFLLASSILWLVCLWLPRQNWMLSSSDCISKHKCNDCLLCRSADNIIPMMLLRIVLRSHCSILVAGLRRLPEVFNNISKKWRPPREREEKFDLKTTKDYYRDFPAMIRASFPLYIKNAGKQVDTIFSLDGGTLCCCILKLMCCGSKPMVTFC